MSADRQAQFAGVAATEACDLSCAASTAASDSNNIISDVIFLIFITNYPTKHGCTVYFID
jgi:hypothetical protein